MGEESSVKLYGMWASPYVLRAKLALQIKGIEYEYIEEDLANKSEQLLQYNPVHKKVPVLVHNGLPVAESTIILEYIDETWTEPPHLLPKDPYLRAKHRFWAAYLAQASEILGKTLMTEGKAAEALLDEYWKKLDVAEELMKAELCPSGCPSFQDVKPGYLDILLYSFFGTADLVKEIFGLESFTEQRYPLLASWAKAVSEVPEAIEVTPPKPKLFELLQAMQQKNLQPKA